MKDNALYLEADEDITSAIDKLSKVSAPSVQIVVPKRSALLQSIINLKLLKKAAENSHKELILVTGDRIAADLAARIGLAVAPAVGGKAVVGSTKPAPTINTDDEVIEASDPLPPSNELASADMPPAPAKAVKKAIIKRREVPDEPDPGQLAGVAAGAVAATTATDANAADSTSSTAPGAATPSAAAPVTKPKVPNFRKLQRRLMWLAAAALMAAGFWCYIYYFTNATVTLYANATRTSIDTSFTVDPAATSGAPGDGVMAGQVVTFSKDLNGPFAPSGKKDVGTKSAGTMTVSNATGIDQPLVANTRFQAPDGKVFKSGSDIMVPKAYLDNNGDKVNGTATVTVTADQNGDTYNEGPATYTIPNLANPKITASGGQMSGGTSKTVTVVTQGDVDAAVAALIDKDKESSTRDLTGRTASGYLGMSASQTNKVTEITAAPAVDSEATSATVSFKVTYTMLSVKKSDYETAIKQLEAKQVGAASEIYDDGLATAQITLTSTEPSGKATFHLTTDAFSGTKIDTAALAKSLAGKRYGDAVDLANRQPSVSHAEITLNPGWMASLPSRSDKITVTIKVASGQK